MITQQMRPVYITEDGAEFGDKVAAQKHELTLFLATARIYWRDTDADEVSSFIFDNWDDIKALVEGKSK